MYIAGAIIGSNPISTFIVLALIFMFVTGLRYFSFFIMNNTYKEGNMNKFVIFTLRFLSFLIEGTWALIISVLSGMIPSFVTSLVALAMYIQPLNSAQRNAS